VKLKLLLEHFDWILKGDFQSSHEAPRCECLHLIKINCLALWLDENAHACTRSELRGASCEDWKSALKPVFHQAEFCARSRTFLYLVISRVELIRKDKEDPPGRNRLKYKSIVWVEPWIIKYMDRKRWRDLMFSMGWWRWNLVANQILKNGMFSDNTAKHFSQRANKYN
jgi:hypothetical protein